VDDLAIDARPIRWNGKGKDDPNVSWGLAIRRSKDGHLIINQCFELKGYIQPVEAIWNGRRQIRSSVILRTRNGWRRWHGHGWRDGYEHGRPTPVNAIKPI